MRPVACGHTVLLAFRKLLRGLAVVAGGLLAVGAALGGGPDGPSAAEAKLDFDRDVAPLLVARCLQCHNSTEQNGGLDLSTRKTVENGGDSGPPLQPGQLAESLLWQRVQADEMPPEKPLSAAERDVLKAWIEQGAGWGTDTIDPFRFSTADRAGYDWWSLQRVTRPDPPIVEAGDRVRNMIDRFVLARLEAAGLGFSAEADRRTLIRRLSFDLRGLPPAPDEVQAFLADGSPDAYERLVERMLASPQYGERWARHWLDVARFGESQGFERDKLRTNAWRYRDWLVRAFNADLPYDRFVRLQVAGDVLEAGPDGVIATGFLTAGAYDEVGQKQQSAAMRAVVRQDELEDIVAAVTQSFLGLTVNCARCHDHKFDPVRQAEYYQLTAALAGVRHGERELEADALRDEDARRIAAAEARIQSLLRCQAAIERPAVEAILASRRGRPAPDVSLPAPLARWEFDGDLRDAIENLHGELHGGARLAGGRLELNGEDAHVVTAPLERDLTEKTLEAWLTLGNLDQRGGGVLSVQTADGNIFDAIVFGEREPGHWVAGSEGYRRTGDLGGPAETEAHRRTVHVALVYQADGTISAYRDGQPYGQAYPSSGPVTFRAGESVVAFGVRHLPANPGRMLAGSIERAQLYDRALTPEEVAASAGADSSHVSREELHAWLRARHREDAERQADPRIGGLVHRDPVHELEQIEFEIRQLRSQQARSAERKVYAVLPAAPEATHVLIRGNPAQPGELVAPDGIASLKGLAADFGLPPDGGDDQRRQRLAQWLTDPHNPLFARVIVNRLWHYHFGTGLVETPNDFGFNGGRPSHPELLDHLADELIRQRYSLKAIQRLIVTSAAYRQSSPPGGWGRPSHGGTSVGEASSHKEARSQSGPQDAPGSRGAAPPGAWREDLELAVVAPWSGLRFTSVVARPAPATPSGSPNPMQIDAGNRLLWRKPPRRLEAEEVRDAMLCVAGALNTAIGGPGYEDFTTYVQNSQFYEMLDPAGPTFHRRSLYRTWVRSGRNRFLDVFDCPDPSTLTPDRASTTTPLQALSLMNNSFVLRMSDRFAERLVREAGADPPRQVERAFQLAHGRSPAPAETELAAAFIQKHGLPAFCRVVFNSNEFLYVD